MTPLLDSGEAFDVRRDDQAQHPFRARVLTVRTDRGVAATSLRIARCRTVPISTLAPTLQSAAIAW
jgi:hypothetical protein